MPTTKRTLVRDVMSQEVKTVGKNESLLEADRIAELQHIRHLPVLDDDGLLCGILTDREVFHSGLLRALGFGDYARRKAADSLLVKEVMRTEVKTVSPDAPLADAAGLLVQHRIGCLPVLDGDRLVGIVTETDIATWVRDHA